MRLGGLRNSGWAAWLGVAALALNALVSVHLAFDLAEACGRSPHNHGHATAPGLEWRVLAALSGHVPHAHHHDHDKNKGHRPNCAVCNALGSLGGLMAAAHPMVLAPAETGDTPVFVSVVEWRDGVPSAYRSRAPPAL
jgi:DUF2946 family protein